MNTTSKSQEINTIRGFRLSKAIESCGIRPAQLLRKAKEQSKHYFDMSPQTLSQIMHGKRPLRYEDAAIFAEILGQDVDYLMGDPDAQMKSLFQFEKDADKYRMLLSRIGANISGYLTDDTDSDTFTGYFVTYNRDPEDPRYYDAIDVPIRDMDSFYQDVCRFIEKRFEILKDICSEEV